MIVYRIIKADWYSNKRPCKGEVLTPPNYDIDNMPEGRKTTEERLETCRKEHFPQLNGRLDSIFVFPADKIEERAFHWASKFAPCLNDSCQCYLLKLETKEPVIWHDASFFEDLSHAYKRENALMKHRMSGEDLMQNYWKAQHNIEDDCIEGLVKEVTIISISSYMVYHTCFKIMEEDIQ